MTFRTSTIIAMTICVWGLTAINLDVGQAQELDQTEISPENMPADLNGIWIIDKKASDDLKQIMRPSQSKRKGGGGGMGGGGGRGGGRGGGMGGGQRGMNNDSGGADQERMMKNMKDLEKEISRLEIFQTGHEFNVTDGMDMTRLLYTDGRDNTVWTRQGKALATAEWTGTTLKVQIHGEDKKQGQIRHYTMSEDGSKLTVLFKKSMGPGGEPRTIRLVYRRN